MELRGGGGKLVNKNFQDHYPGSFLIFLLNAKQIFIAIRITRSVCELAFVKAWGCVKV